MELSAAGHLKRPKFSFARAAPPTAPRGCATARSSPCSWAARYAGPTGEAASLGVWTKHGAVRENTRFYRTRFLTMSWPFVSSGSRRTALKRSWSSRSGGERSGANCGSGPPENLRSNVVGLPARVVFKYKTSLHEGWKVLVYGFSTAKVPGGLSVSWPSESTTWPKSWNRFFQVTVAAVVIRKRVGQKQKRAAVAVSAGQECGRRLGLLVTFPNSKADRSFDFGLAWPR